MTYFYSTTLLTLLQEPSPVLPDFSKYGFGGAVIALLVAALWMLWRRLNAREDLLLKIANEHSDKLSTVVEKTNAALDGVKDSMNNLASEIRILVEQHRQ